MHHVQQYQAWYPISHPLFRMVWQSMRTHAYFSTFIPNDHRMPCSMMQPVLTKTCVVGQLPTTTLTLIQQNAQMVFFALETRATLVVTD